MPIRNFALFFDRVCNIGHWLQESKNLNRCYKLLCHPFFIDQKFHSLNYFFVISRCIAETHYQLGVALGFNAQFDEAVNALSDAIAVLEKRIGFLKEGKASIGKII